MYSTRVKRGPAFGSDAQPVGETKKLASVLLVITRAALGLPALRSRHNMGDMGMERRGIGDSSSCFRLPYPFSVYVSKDDVTFVTVVVLTL